MGPLEPVSIRTAREWRAGEGTSAHAKRGAGASEPAAVPARAVNWSAVCIRGGVRTNCRRRMRAWMRARARSPARGAAHARTGWCVARADSRTGPARVRPAGGGRRRSGGGVRRRSGRRGGRRRGRRASSSGRASARRRSGRRRRGAGARPGNQLGPRNGSRAVTGHGPSRPSRCCP